MKKQELLVMAWLVFPILLFSQVVNIENERIKSHEKEGWKGAAKAAFSIVKNVGVLYDFSANAHLQYKRGKNLWLILGETALIKVENEDFSNLGFGHFRYNRSLNSFLKWEAFVQGQYNKIAMLEFRGLVGTGPRFKLTQNDKYRIYLGTLVMYEYEEETMGAIHRNFRMSDYLSFTFEITPNLTIVNTTYYQPLFDDWSDFRLSSETSFVLKITQRLAFDSSYRILYDTEPPMEAPNTIYSWKNGLSLQF